MFKIAVRKNFSIELSSLKSNQWQVNLNMNHPFLVDRSTINCLISGVAYASSLRCWYRKLEAYATYLSKAI